MDADSGQGHAGPTSEDADAAGGSHPGLPDARSLARDWITLWQSELAALAADPEMREAWQTLAGLWAGTMGAMLQAMPRGPHGPEGPSGGTRAQPAPRAPAAAATPDTRDAEIDRLARHIAALERRLADIERGGGAGRPAGRRPRRKS